MGLLAFILGLSFGFLLGILVNQDPTESSNHKRENVETRVFKYQNFDEIPEGFQEYDQSIYDNMQGFPPLAICPAQRRPK